GDLECGVTLPFTEPVRLKLSHDHVTATQLHHCCSGKHTGMLSVCKHVGWKTNGYTAYDHPLQAKIREHMSLIFGVDANSLDHASDGCSVPTYALPLDVMALGFAKLGAERFSDEFNAAARRLRNAQASAPFMVAGSDRLDTQLLEAGRGRLQVKMGAEGVYLGAIADREIGFALKCEDGSLRGQEALVVELLRGIGEKDIVDRLPDNVRKPVVTTARGEAVGRISVRRSC
ncbi:MAG: asparaginase, partial [Gammaproteobacteria bacterium]